MELQIQYLTDDKGAKKAVQIPINQWQRILKKSKSFEQQLRLKNDLTEALSDVKKMRKGTKKKTTLLGFLNEL